MQGYRYSLSSLRGDYVRAGLGMLFTGLMLIGAISVPVMFFIISTIFILFAGFGVQTWLRHLTMVCIETDGINIYGIRRRQISWENLKGTKLRFFSTKRDRDTGWMELTLLTSSGKFKIDSSIDGFNGIAKAVAKNLDGRNIKIDPTSVENFNAIGVATHSPGLPEAVKRLDKVKPWKNEI